MRPTLAFALVPALALMGCSALPGAKPKQVAVAQGTKVELMLMQPLDAGGSEVGLKVPLALAEDLMVDGQVVARKGTVVEGKVTRSRGASVAAQLIRQPARLEIEVGELATTGGDALALAGTYEFTRENTQADVRQSRLETAWDTPEGREALSKLAERLADGDRGARLDDPETEKALALLAKDLGLEDTRRLIEGDGASEGLAGTLRALEKGNLSTLAGGELSLALGAISELGRVAGSVDRTLRERVKAPTIRAPIGTRLTVEVAEAAEVAVR